MPAEVELEAQDADMWPVAPHRKHRVDDLTVAGLGGRPAWSYGLCRFAERGRAATCGEERAWKEGADELAGGYDVNCE